MQQRIQVSNFEAACHRVEAAVGVAILPESAARRLDALPAYARELVDLLVEDARQGIA